MPSLRERSELRDSKSFGGAARKVEHVIQSDTLLTTMVTTFPLLSERQASLVGYGNFMHIRSEPLPSRHAKVVTRIILGEYFGGEARRDSQNFATM